MKKRKNKYENYITKKIHYNNNIRKIKIKIK